MRRSDRKARVLSVPENEGDVYQHLLVIQDDLNEIDQNGLPKSVAYWLGQVHNRVAHLIFDAERRIRERKQRSQEAINENMGLEE